jgi:hypothetical protein
MGLVIVRRSNREALPSGDGFPKTAHPAIMPVMQLATVSTIAQTIQLSLSPVFMLAGISGLLNVLAGRLSRVVDRARALEALHPRSTGPEHDRHVWELRLLDRRIVVINAALFLAVSSAVMTCLVVALLFIAELADLKIGTYVALTFIFAMIFLISSLVAFMVEVRMSLRAVHIRAELLEHR